MRPAPRIFSFAESDYQAVKKVMLEMVRAAGGAEA